MRWRAEKRKRDGWWGLTVDRKGARALSERVNPFSAATWFWRGWRGRSVTFAALFALGVLGISALGWFRHLLRGLGAPWYLWLLLPLAVVSVLARKETEWLPDPERRRKWAWGVMAGAILLALLVAKLAPEKPEPVYSRPVPGRAGK